MTKGTKLLIKLRDELKSQLKADENSDGVEKFINNRDYSKYNPNNLHDYRKFFDDNPVVVEILDIQTGAELAGRDPEDAQNVCSDFIYPRSADPIDDPSPISHRQLLKQVNEAV